MGKPYSKGIYSGIGGQYDYKDKDRNVQHMIAYMLNRTLKMFEYENMPETIPVAEFERLLQVNGFAFVTEVEGELYAFNGGLGGEPDVYGKPTQITIANPALRFNKTLDIAKDGVLVKNDHVGIGLIPLFARYSTILNENEITMILATISKRVSNLISVSDDNTAKSAELYLKKLVAGELGYIMENKLFDSLKSTQTNDSGSVRMSDLIEFQQYMKASLFNEIGLNSNYNMKKERLITQEVEINSNSIFPLVDNMRDCRLEAIEKINEMYGTNISVRFGSSWKYIDEMVSRQGENDTEGLEEVENVTEGLEEVENDTEGLEEVVEESVEEELND